MPDADPHGIEVHDLETLNDDDHFPDAYAHKGARRLANEIGVALLNVRKVVGASGSRSRGDLHMIVQDDVQKYFRTEYEQENKPTANSEVRSSERRFLLSWYYTGKKLSDLDQKTVTVHETEEKEEKERKESPDLSDVEDVAGQKKAEAGRLNLEDHAESSRQERQRPDPDEAADQEATDMTLWQWDDAVRQLRDRVDQIVEERMDPETGEIDDAVDQALTELDALEGKLEQKVENCGKMLEFFLDRAEEWEGKADFHRRRRDAAQSKVDAIEDRIGDMEKAADGLKRYVQRYMIQKGLDEIEGGEYRFRLVGKGGRPPLVIEGLPDTYLKHRLKADWIPSELSSMERMEVAQAIDTLRDVLGNQNVKVETRPDKRWLKDRLDEGDEDVSEHVSYVERKPKLKIDGIPE